MLDIIAKLVKHATEQLLIEKVRRMQRKTRDGFQIFIPSCMVCSSEACFSSDHH